MRGKFRLQPLLIGLLFLGPFALALFLYYGPFQTGRLPKFQNSEREFIRPPPRLPAVGLTTSSGAVSDANWARGRWSLIYARSSACGDECLRQVNRLSQVYFALGRDHDRARRVFLFGGAELPFHGGADMLVARLSDAPGRKVTKMLGAGKIQQGRIFVADPHGNLILSYPPNADRSQLLKDLKRLLKLSTIG